MLETDPTEPIKESEGVYAKSPLIYHCDQYDIELSFDNDDWQLPEGTELSVKELHKDAKKDSEEYSDYHYYDDRAIEELSDQDEELAERAYALHFYELLLKADGEEISMPEGTADITIKYNPKDKSDYNAKEFGDGETILASLFWLTDWHTLLFEKNSDDSKVYSLKDKHLNEIHIKDLELSDFDNVIGLYACPPEKKVTLKAEGNDYSVTASCGQKSRVPEDAKLTVSEIKPGSKAFEQYLESAREALGEENENAVPAENARFFDIKIMVDGKEFTPEAEIDVKIDFHEPVVVEQMQDVNAIHFSEEGTEVLDVATEEGQKGIENVSFTADSFSVYGVVYTVDFHYEMNGKTYDFSIPGGGFVSLEHMMEVLGIANPDTHSEKDSESAGNLADVRNAEFSDPDLVWVGKVENESTVGGLKEANDLECEYSANLTEKQIEEINAQMVKAGDWALISMHPFTSEESLTVTMKNGDQFVVHITDAQIQRTFISASGETYVITAAYGPETGIPEDAKLEVEEILPTGQDGSDRTLAYGKSYEEYVAYAENTLEMREGSAEYIRLFDIKIVDKDDPSVKYQPARGSKVDVKIELADAESGSLSVIHFADGEDTPDVMENTDVTTGKENGQVVEFRTDGFSVYAVVSRENVTGSTALDGKTYALVTNNNRLLMGEAHPTIEGRLAAQEADPAVGGTLLADGTAATWSFEAVPGQPGWYYISNGNGKYINITSASGNSGTVTLGEKQAIYVDSKSNGSDVSYQLRNGAAKKTSKAVNNYNNRVDDGFGAWKAGDGNNEWFRLYDVDYLGESMVSFDENGGTGPAPSGIYGLAGDSITLPDYTGARDGYTFLGWSTHDNVVNRDYYPVYPAGTEFTIPDHNTTLYATWTNNNPAQGQFYIRLDGTIPYEPDQYDSSAYTGAINITGAIKNQAWVTDNDVNKPNNGLYIENNVTANLNQVPSVDQIVNNINNSSQKLGFNVRNDNGDIVVQSITNATTNANNYHVAEGDSLYILWYVQKYAGSWHEDGTLLVKNKVNIAYDGNTPDGSARNVPLGYQESVGTEITIGASGSKNGTDKIPTRPGYIFLGWNTKPDGSGTAYNNNDIYELNEDTTLYAQWSKGKNMMTVSKTNEDGETLAGAQFKLEEKTASGDFIEKANRTTGANGTFTYDQMENDTLYRMTETYAPNGYEIQNSFYFKVAVDDSSSETLHLHVCDENGNFISTPDWLIIDYIAADDPRAQGVARIQFNIKDERIKRSITFIKTDEDGNPLSGAEYTLTGSKGPVSGVLKDASDSNGVFSVEDAVLPYGSYTLTEDKAPVMYAPGDPVTFTLNDYVSASDTGLTITSGSATASCDVSSVTEQGLTITTYAYTVTVKDTEQAHIIVTKQAVVDGNLNPNDLNTTVYFALTKKGEEGYVTKDSGEIWIESLEIINGVATPGRVVFDGVDYGEYDVWEMALIDGEYTRMYNGLVVADNFQLDSVSASSADGGNNANVSGEDLEAQVDFTNHYGEITQSTSFIANKRWSERDGTIIEPPAGAVIEFTLYSEKKDANGQIIDGTLETVRSIRLDGAHDPDGEDSPWQAVFKYLPIYYEGTLEYSYKVKETVTAEGYYPNEYPQEYYLTSSNGTITNRRLTTDVELHKEFELYPENADLLSKVSGLTFTLTKPDESSAEYTLSDFSASVENPYDYVLTLHDLPLGTYSFTESGQDSLLSSEGYNLVYSVSSVNGESEVGDEEQPVLKLELQNSYAKSGSLVVKKNSVIYEAVDETTIPPEISGKTFDFVVKRGSLYLQENGTLSRTPYVFSLSKGGAKVFDSVPAGEYTVIEQNASVEGYIWEVVDGTRNADDTYSKTLTIDDTNNAGEASFDNRYTKIENGSLTVSKAVVSGPGEASTKAYKIEIQTTRHGQPVWLDEEGNLVSEKTVLNITPSQPLSFPTVPAGTYTVKEDETDAAFEEYSLDVTYQAENDFVIHKDGQENVTITNTYTYLYTPVKITKTVTGNMGDKKLYFGFDVYVTDENDQPLVVEGITDDKGLIQFSIKDGEEHLIEKLPKGARLRIVEHSAHYTVTVNGRVGVGDDETTEELTAEEVSSDLQTDTTETYIFTIPDTGATVDFINDHTVEKQVILKKIGFDNRDESTWNLAGAVFKIYEDAEKKRPVELDGKTEFTSGEDGVFYQGKLGVGTYYLDEVRVPGGYNALAGMFILQIEENCVSLGSTETIGQPDLNDWITSETVEPDPESTEAVYTVSIRNTIGAPLPATGGSGNMLFTFFGSLLILGAGLLLWRRRSII